MAVYRTEIETSWDAPTAFSYLATFAHAAEWDPGVAAAERLDEGALAVGSAWRLQVLVAGRRRPFVYRVVALDPGRRVTLSARTALLTSTDTVEVVPDPDGSVVRYHARLEGRGVLQVGDALLQRVFVRIGDRAAAGLRETLPPRAQAAPAPR